MSMSIFINEEIGGNIMDKKIGFIGCGNMAQAMIGGIIKSKLVLPSQVMASAITEKNLNFAKDKYGILVSSDNIDTAKFSDIIILAVKPNIYDVVIEEIKGYIKKDSIIITIAAGITLSFTEKAFGHNIKVIRTMPNTPALVGEGMSVLCANELVTKEELELVIKIFEGFGKSEVISEKLMDAIPAISGSSPAYVYMFIEALADGGVLDGIPRDKAYKLAAQAVLGAAKMVLETGMHPGALKDNVCSPGGSTIEAVSTLEEKGFRSAVLSAMKSCTNKSKEMSK
jgi:pyrroline-5-carboxylate reductase